MPEETNKDNNDQAYNHFLKAKPERESKLPENEKEISGDEKFSLPKYLKNAYKELRKVTWPTRDEAIKSTGVVIAFSVIVALFLGALDYVFTAGLDYILSIQA